MSHVNCSKNQVLLGLTYDYLMKHVVKVLYRQSEVVHTFRHLDVYDLCKDVTRVPKQLSKALSDAALKHVHLRNVSFFLLIIERHQLAGKHTFKVIFLGFLLINFGD